MPGQSGLLLSAHLSLSHLEPPLEHLKETPQTDAQHHDKHVQVGPRECQRQVDDLQERNLPELELKCVIDVGSPGLVGQLQDV